MTGKIKWADVKPKISDVSLTAVGKLGFQLMTPVQAACIPLFLSKKDVAVEAVTGSGKTLAFVIPVTDMLMNREVRLGKHEVGAIILSPTWELANQIYSVMKVFTDVADLSCLLCVGGTDPESNVKQFHDDGANIIIATPGRLADLFDRKQMNLRACIKELEVLILDEADRLLELGYEKSINSILSCLPKQRRTGLFSATQTEQVETIVRAGLRNPVRVTINQDQSSSLVNKRTPDSLQNFYAICEEDMKFSALVSLLRQHRDEKCIVFVSTCAGVEFFAKAIASLMKKSEILSIHGKMKQKRGKVFSKFKSIESGVLVTTDVMARGVDIPNVAWVYQYDPPSNASAFVHRCGRTARIGNIGKALLFLLPSEEPYVEFLSINQKAPMEQLELGDDVVDVAPKLRKIAAKDRDIMEKGLRAFVSFIQSYRKHECSLIFKIKELNIGKLASGYGLLKLPKMPEIKANTAKDFTTMEGICLEDIPYRDKIREKARQKRKVADDKAKVGKRDFSKKQNAAWSKEKERKEKKFTRKEKKATKRKKTDSYCQGDVDDISQEIALMKKLKRKKITKEEFNLAVADEIDTNP